MDTKLVKQLKESSAKIGQLLPAFRAKDGDTVDGKHRKAADPNWRTVQIDEIDTPEKKILARLALNWTRRNMKREEITRELVSLCELHPECKGHYSQMIVERTGYDIDTIEKYLPDKYKQQHTPRPLVLDFSKGEEYVKLMLSKYGVDAFFEVKGEKVPMPSEHDRQFIRYHYNVWEADSERPKGYGEADFPGNTSPNVARDILLRYTKEGDLVLDSMAGSGTIMDMCQELKRQCVSYDIAPLRPDIKEGDARTLPHKDNSVDFIFNHFPYSNMHRYSYHKGDLSGMSQQQFLEESKKVMVEAHRILKPDHYYVVLIGDQRKEKELIDWSAKFSIIGRDLFKLHDKIIWYAKGQSAYRQSDKYDLIAAEHNFCMQTFDTLLIFKK